MKKNKKNLKLLLSMFIAAVLLSACGGNKTNGKLYEETQRFSRVSVDDYVTMMLSSYNINEIDGKPIALALNFTVGTNPQLWLFNLLNVRKENMGEDTPLFNVNIKQITLSVDNSNPTLINVKRIGNTTLMYLPISKEEATNEVDLLFGYITSASETSVTAMLDDGKEYTWNFHSSLDHIKNK